MQKLSLFLKTTLNLRALGAIIFCLYTISTASAQESPQHQLVLYSKTQTIDGIYRSMTGPSDNKPFVFNQNGKPDLLWVTGFKVEVIDPVTKKLKSPEYLCHSHVRFNTPLFDVRKRDPLLSPGLMYDIKLVTLIQGRTDIHFPAGFGVPVLSNEPFIFHSMVINNNPLTKPFELQVKATFDYMKDSQLKSPMKALFRRCLTLQVPLAVAGKDKKHVMCVCELGMDEDSEIDAEPVATATAVTTTPKNVYKNVRGQNISFHWYVPPGRHRYRYEVGTLRLPYDTTAHYIAIHLHPFGTFCALRDLTLKKTIYKSLAVNFKDRVGLEKSEAYSSPVGIPLFKNHRYEITCEYNNTTSHDIDAMAVMYIYLLNKNFDKNSLHLVS